MKCLLVGIAATVLLVVASLDASAAEPNRKASTQQGTISASQLSAMGLSGVAVMPDREAENIRGQGYVRTYSRSYVRGGSTKRGTKRGRNYSFSYSFSYGSGVYSGGYSYAYAY